MKYLLFFVFFAGGIPVVTLANTGGFASSPEDEIAYRSFTVLQRFEREDYEGAISLVKRYFTEFDTEANETGSIQSGARKKITVIQHISHGKQWRSVPGEVRALILKQALKIYPLSARAEREIIYLLAETDSLEGMANIITYTVIANADRRLVGSSIYSRILPNWRYKYRWVLKSGDILGGGVDEPVRDEDVKKIFLRWSKKFTHADQLVALVNKSTSSTTLTALRVILMSNPVWATQLSEVQKNRLQFWERSKSCEEDLAGRES